jgi:hypothetical protein
MTDSGPRHSAWRGPDYDSDYDPAFQISVTAPFSFSSVVTRLPSSIGLPAAA